MAKTLGERIRARREELGMSQVELADAIGIRAHVMWRYEAGKSRPGADRLAEIASALKTTSEALLHGESESPPETTYEPLDDESIPPIDRMLASRFDYSPEKKRWIRGKIAQFKGGDNPDSIWEEIKRLATIYEYEAGRKLPLSEHETVVADPRDVGDDVMIRPRNKKPKR